MHLTQVINISASGKSISNPEKVLQNILTKTLYTHEHSTNKKVVLKSLDNSMLPENGVSRPFQS